MRVVSNTSPLCNLAIIDRLELLKRRYGRVSIPPAVEVELFAMTHPEAKARIASALGDGWLVVELPTGPGPTLPYPLDVGETEAIALALSTGADVLLMDERRGREVARRNGLTVAGVLGELLHARHSGRVANLRDEIKHLRTEAGFFVDAEIERFILSQAGD